jgi:hypothetical protein
MTEKPDGGMNKEESRWTQPGIIFGIPLAAIVATVIWFFRWVFWRHGLGNMSLNSFSLLLLLVWVLMNAALFLVLLLNAEESRRNLVAAIQVMTRELVGMAAVAIGVLVGGSLLSGASFWLVQQARNAWPAGM